MTELSPRYNPSDVESRIYERWESSGLFHAEPDPSKKPYTIVIPPPNVTGILHMGHALNNTIQDILIRYQRMQGLNALWVPGTDHAGIATQNVVEKSLAKEGKRRHDLGREAFVERVWAWKEQYGNTIIRQLKRLGSSCDWSRTRFTMDAGLSEAVAEVFVQLYEQGLIYRGTYIINWCPRCQTALSDEEAPRKETHGKLYYIKYPLAARQLDSSTAVKPTSRRADEPTSPFIVVATTRPETMLGDTAIAVHPKDKRYKALFGREAMLPIVNRRIRIIADEMVDKSFGTGAVKVTPAHDPADFQLGKKHKLDFINVMTGDGRMTAVPDAYKGLDRFECRKKLLDDLQAQGLLEKVEEHLHNVGHCYRCDTVIEPRLSLQWFVKMKPLAKDAIEAVKKKKITFTPSRWTKVYLNWMENIQDWCISRQIWWGHRLPVYYCQTCARQAAVHSSGFKVHSKSATSTNYELRTMNSTGIIVSQTWPERCPTCGGTELEQDPDVLDTWFSSWLWPFSTLGWPKQTKDLDYFYPTNTLVTAPEIIFFWVARMIMAGYFCMKKPPFTHVYIHGTVRDLTGKKMSKSLGNIIDPLEIIDQFGADALRYTLMTSTAVGTDVFISEEKFVVGRNFANKLWNATRYLLSADSQAISRPLPPPRALALDDDQWILSRLQHTITHVTKELEAFRFHEAANTIYEFVWHDVCDWYLELGKIVDINVAALLEEKPIEPQSEQDREFRERMKTSQTVLAHVLSTSLRLFHPFMPFITEELWGHLRPAEMSESIMTAPWPKADKHYVNDDAERRIAQLQAIIREVREIRREFLIEAGKKPTVSINARSEQDAAALKRSVRRFSRLAQMEIGEIGVNIARPAHSIPVPINHLELYISIGKVVDVAIIREHLTKEADALAQHLRSLSERLSNRDFLSKAPPVVIESEKAKQTQWQATLGRLKSHLAALS